MLRAESEYDYIIAGAGAAGLSLAINLAQSQVHFKKILLVDSQIKTSNDRTWCFWTTDKTAWYLPLANKSWQHLEFRSEIFQQKIDIAPYQYHMIRSADFYVHCQKQLMSDSRFEFRQCAIKELRSSPEYAELVSDEGSFKAQRIFNSAIRTPHIKKTEINFVQHFKGWIIKTNKPAFDPTCPLFMDFKIPQHNDCRFVYILPHSETEALVEYTGFSAAAIADEEYDLELRNYLTNTLALSDYEILETEKGSIPMYESAFENPFGARVTNIGTAGGASKASTGFTFYFIQKQVEAITKKIESAADFGADWARPSRFLFYDRVLLKVMQANYLPVSKIFGLLFKKNKVQNILAFLNEQSTLKQELKLLSSLPPLPFIKAALQKL